MVRDDRWVEINETRVLENLTNGQKNFSYPKRAVMRTFRSDSVSTEPWPNGGYHATTGYEAFFGLVNTGPGSVEWAWKPTGIPSYRLSWTGGQVSMSLLRHGCTPQFKPDIPSWLISQCRAQMHRQVNEDLDIAEFAGEARETAKLIGNVLENLLKILRSFRGGNLVGWANTSVHDARQLRKSDAAARSYLSIMYGVRPLVQDIIKIANHWDDRLKAPVSKDLYVEMADGSFGPPPNTAHWWYEGKFRRGIKSGARAVVVNAQLLRASQYGLTSPLSLAWELTTLSFVIDWFTGIGAFIRGFETPLGVAIEDYYETQWVDNRFVVFEDVYGGLYENAYTYLKGPRSLIRSGVRAKAMLRTQSGYILPPPPYLRLGITSDAQIFTLLALIKVYAGRR